MLSVEEAQALVMGEIAPGAVEEVPFTEANGRVLREDLVATADAPEGDNSAMDGYAVRAEDVANAPVTMPVMGDIAAGHPSSSPLRAGAAMRIMTGALVPSGADAVVQVELTDGGTSRVRIEKGVRVGANVRRRGEDMRAGDVVVREGTRIGAAEMAMFAALQKTTVRVGARPTVAILSTGDELIDVQETRRPGTIVNTNGPLLQSLVRETGAIPRPLGIVRDTREATIAALESALASDFVITSGGVSVGAYDFVKGALEALGAETKFWRVAMKPGKPVVLSRARDRVVFGLPGNPVSCFVSFHLFVAPALRKAMGVSGALFPPTLRARLLAPVRSAGDRRVYVRVALSAQDGALVARPLATQGSGSLTSMIGANGLAIMRERVTSVAEGESIDVVVLGAIG
ncbi:MAG TPA: gephyrin-like molybdotransferase Glp [Thermoanaerobaculia bacterium]|nr:gephyrin-like molybdotransferase Glp [Thermoanaerobaculia bacterium]